jgi:hypothetical protein
MEHRRVVIVLGPKNRIVRVVCSEGDVTFVILREERRLGALRVSAEAVEGLAHADAAFVDYAFQLASRDGHDEVLDEDTRP